MDAVGVVPLLEPVALPVVLRTLDCEGRAARKVAEALLAAEVRTIYVML